MANTDNIRGTNVALVSWITAVIMFFVVAIKLGTRMMVMKRFSFSIDEALILAAMVSSLLSSLVSIHQISSELRICNSISYNNLYMKALALGQTGAIWYAAKSGLGMHQSTMTSAHIASYQEVCTKHILSTVLWLMCGSLSMLQIYYLLQRSA
jgi:hypothetical protein